jgi:acyl-CoA reductase-like NAD-dependent aldehyde dehydrogenase
MNKLISINPSTYKPVGEVEISSDSEIKNKVALAHKAKQNWNDIGLEKRIKLLRKAFEEFMNRKEEFALLQTREMGMPINSALSDVNDSVSYANWYMDNAEKYLSPETTLETDTEIHQVFYEPVGVVASITPWNFPFANFVWACAQSLIAGNTVILKHSEECPLSGKFIEEVLTKHLPEGVFNEVYGAGDVGEKLTDQDINMITFTGSTKVGKYLYKKAGEKFIKAVMELGGSAPALIFEDANIAIATENVCVMRLLNQGQCCDGLKRLIVHESKYEEVVTKLTELFKNKKIGNAEDKSTEMGPLVAKRQLTLLEAQVKDAMDKGAKVLTGGKSLEKELGGAFYAPTVLANVTKDMRVWTEEVFGPVLPVVTFKTDDEAIKLANETKYGLGSYVYTESKERADKISKALQTGMVSINSTNYVIPQNPFGGYKDSGIGREHGKYGFQEVTQIKLVSKTK